MKVTKVYVTSRGQLHTWSRDMSDVNNKLTNYNNDNLSEPLCV